MIKYIELTAPQTSAFRQTKILSIECQEGDKVKQGDTLFMVKSGDQEIALPATCDGKICEMIAVIGENITLSTALLLMETEVTDNKDKKAISDTKKKPSQNDLKAQTKTSPKIKKKKTRKKTAKKKTRKKTKVKEHQQQSLDLVIDGESVTPDPQLDTQIKPQPEDPDSMSSDDTIEIHVPDIGGDTAKVIEILVNPGDQIEEEQALITLESDKASMDVPSTVSGVLSSIEVRLDDDIGEGTLIAKIDTGASAQSSEQGDARDKDDSDQETPASAAPTVAPKVNEQESSDAQTTSTSVLDVLVPDIGGDAAKVIEFLVAVGDTVAAEDSLLTLESDKASMDVPCPADGTIASLEVSIDQEVSEGTLIATLTTSHTESHKSQSQVPAEQASASESKPSEVEQKATPLTNNDAKPKTAAQTSSVGKSHASPSIRRLGRELGVDLSKVSGSGRKGRILKDDVKAYVKNVMESSQSVAQTSSGSGIPAIPAQDFSKFGDIDVQPLNKIKRLTATNLHRSWVNVPHVTHNDEANINELEAFRKKVNQGFKDSGEAVKVSPLAFIVKAIVRGLKEYPQFNSSLEPSGENLIYKKYFNVGIAVDTPNGLVVPVIKNADTKSVSQVATEMGELAAKARDGKLSIADMSGACITISSLGGIGGTSFTPIVNAPEVAILGVSRSKIKPVWNGQEFEPGMMLPLSLSYDHRVIDGAEAARFTRHIAEVLEDVRLLSI